MADPPAARAGRARRARNLRVPRGPIKSVTRRVLEQPLEEVKQNSEGVTDPLLGTFLDVAFLLPDSPVAN